jgi:hypothetical protein
MEFWYRGIEPQANAPQWALPVDFSPGPFELVVSKEEVKQPLTILLREEAGLPWHDLRREIPAREFLFTTKGDLGSVPLIRE